jgi:LemA protein
MTEVIVAAVVVGLFVLGFVVSYNRFIDDRQTITNSWSNVETELQRRHDVVPNLVETVKGYAGHERVTFENVIRARADAQTAAGSPAALAGPENQLVNGLRRLLAVSEAYPDLKASEQFLDLQRQLITTENRIQAARRVYNGNVREYNRRVDAIPSNIVARAGRFAHCDYFEVEPLVRQAGAPAARFSAGNV